MCFLGSIRLISWFTSQIGGSFSGISLTRSVILSSQLLQSWGISLSLRMTSWLGATLRCSWCLSVSVPGRVLILVCLVCPLVSFRGILLFPCILILWWGCFPLLWQGKLSGGPTCGPPSWLHSLSWAAQLSCVIFPFVAILLFVFFDSLKDTFLVSITLLPIQIIPGLLKSRIIPIFLKNGVPSIALLLWTEISEANDRVAKSNGSVVGGTWLQLICCTLPKRLCP